MKIDCCMITTNLKDRLYLVSNAINSINKLSDTFNQKILSVDIFDEGESIDWYNQFQKDGWKIVTKNVSVNGSIRGSMILNQRNAVSNAGAEIVLYTEDDILINNLPKVTTINKLFNEKLVNGKRTGFICFNNHVWSKFNENPKHIIDFIHDLNNYITVDGDVFLIKNEVIKDKYYLNFPVSLTTKKLFLELQDYTFKNKVGFSHERALTEAWFETEKDKEYVVLISLKNEIIDDIKSGKRITVLDFYNYANINFWNNDLTLRPPQMANRKILQTI